MASAVLTGQNLSTIEGPQQEMALNGDPFLSNPTISQNGQSHRYSSHFDPEFFILGPASSPSQVKRTLEAHLSETERRLQDTQKLGKSLLQQQSELADRLREVEQQQNEAEISPELRQRLVELEKEHNEVGREIARALLGPKVRAVSGEEKDGTDNSAILTSHASGSPTKITAPSRKQRNQPPGRVGDIQFAADISTSLLAQVRQMQAMLAERDETLKTLNLEKSKLEQENEGFLSRLRALDESEQRYKDENWNLETQAHELRTAAHEASEREKRLNASLVAALAEKNRAQNELDEVRLAHEQLKNDHATAKKTYDFEVHGLKKDLDLGDNERDLLQSKIDELTAQNKELARGMASRSRGRNSDENENLDQGEDEISKDIDTPEHSPPPSPTKATPRHGGLESETLKSSLHHAHRMIQNLKGTIHREKTEKVELRRLLQDARDELEQRRTDASMASGSKRQKPRPEPFKKPVRPEILGASRRTRTDVEVQDEDWEDNAGITPIQTSSRTLAVPGAFETPRTTDVSDAYQTATETDAPFDTADEKHGTESEDFQTGAESLTGDSTDELTEREDNASKGPRSSLAFKPAGDRSSYLSTASTSADEEEEQDLRTPVQAQPQKFRLKNGRQSLGRQSRIQRESTPENFYSQVTLQDSPATVNTDRSPPAVEQSLFAELAGFDDASSDRYNTPGRSSVLSQKSTPNAPLTVSRAIRDITPTPSAKAIMVDNGTMTEPWGPEPVQLATHQLRDSAGSFLLGSIAGSSLRDSQLLPPSPSDFPLPLSLPASPPTSTDKSTQYTPAKNVSQSPLRNMEQFNTPPKTVWDEEQDGDRTPETVMADDDGRSRQSLGFSGLLSQDTVPVVENVTDSSGLIPKLDFSSIQTQDTFPLEPLISQREYSTVTDIGAQSTEQRPRTAEKTAERVATGRMLATAAAALGLSSSRETKPHIIAEDETSQNVADSSESENLPLQDVSGNAGPRLIGKKGPVSDLSLHRPMTVSQSDQGAQTLLTAKEIDEALRAKSPAEAIASGPVLSQTHQSPVSSNTTRTPPRTRDSTAVGEAAPLIGSAPKRPSSANSQRASSIASQHPPLPPGHRTAIARASAQISPQPSPGREPNNSSHIATMMGPPIAPASAYRRPKTPAESSIRSPTRDGTTPRMSTTHHRHSTRDRSITSQSQLSRRSSVSSFASELDERFNIRADAPTASHGFEPSSSTDPRMIQAITQTMIGEFLWKYTRKAGSTDMSNTRHRRYFWVHPYTKTLYWSNTDPQSAGRNELKAKSVLIQSVRVVSDDNPMPPGLHRTSMEIVSLGRKVKVTASTSQRHEVWFNALSYLLLRGDGSGAHQQMKSDYANGERAITDADVDEFRVGGYGGPDRDRSRTLLRPPTGSRASLSSYNSRGTSANRSAVRVAPPSKTNQLVHGTAVSRTGTVVKYGNNPSQQGQSKVEEEERNRTIRASSKSRLSRVLGSVTGTTKRVSGRNLDNEPGNLQTGEQDEAIYDASLVSNDGRRDSDEELRREMLKQEREGLGSHGGGGQGLENVRSCCDGKISSLFVLWKISDLSSPLGRTVGKG